LLIFETRDSLLIGVVIMVLLRPTNRLNALLAEHGYKLNHPGRSLERDYPNGVRKWTDLSFYAVFEADYPIAENSPSDANTFGSIRNCLKHYGSSFPDGLSVKRLNGGQQLAAPNVPKGKLDRVDILWVSPTEFVSTKIFDELNCEDVYQLTVSLKGDIWPLELYSYSMFQFNDDGEIMAGPPPVTPPRFLSHVLAPILDQVTSIKLFTHRGTPPVDSTLSLIPTTGDNLAQEINICFSPPQSGLLPALATFPFHPNVRLSFERVPDSVTERAQIHDYLLDLKHLRHLEIPSCLLDFECTRVPFTANPAFESLTLPTKSEAGEGFAFLMGWSAIKWSSTMLNGVASNKNLKCLNIVFTDGKNQRSRQETLEQLAKVLASGSSHGHAISRLSTNELVTSNPLWDSVFSPALVVNWLKQQQQKPTGQLNHRLSGLAIRAINQGAGFRGATNLIPCDLAPSSASAIFLLAISQHDESKNVGSPHF
jgi:hypothetical protein